MRAYTLSHVRDHALLRSLTTLVAIGRVNDAAVLARIAEVDARKLYLPAAYSSMHAYCVQALGFSEDAAAKRIHAARAARDFPAIFEAVADGRLNLSAVVLLAPHLTPGNAAGLLDAAYGRSKFEIQQLIAQRFPKSELLALVQPLPDAQHAPGHVQSSEAEHAPGHVAARADESAPGRIEKRSTVKPHAAGRYALELTIGQGTYDKLQQAQALLSHALPSGEIAEVLDRALDVLIAKLARRRCGAARTPRTPRRRASANPRSIPAHVRNAVWARDGGQCTFVSATGQRCGAKRLLEYDHVDPVARGGTATVAGLRLLCRAHNQFEAERTYGAGFMAQKREQARRTAEARCAADPAADMRPAAVTAIETPAPPAVDEHAADIMAGLRGLRYNAEQARQAAAYSATTAATTLEARMRAALQYLAPRAQSQKPN